MTQYIDKDALVAEIERYKHKADERLKIKGRTLVEDCKDSALQNLCGNLLHFIDTFEVREVKEEPISNDFEEEYDNYTKDILACDIQFEPFTHLHNCAKYFYELGLKAKGEEE